MIVLPTTLVLFFSHLLPDAFWETHNTNGAVRTGSVRVTNEKKVKCEGDEMDRSLDDFI